jgi:hypothetical protein
MTEIQDPGVPRTDPMAENAARNALTEVIGGAGGKYIAASVLSCHVATWERDVNSAGVPVRRYVLRSEWLVDPDAITELIFPGDTVTYRDRRDDGREWTVGHVVNNYLISMTSPGLDEVAEFRHAVRSELIILRHAASPRPNVLGGGHD